MASTLTHADRLTGKASPEDADSVIGFDTR
jgi:hypothetical protein